ncbi:MAG: FAD-dependent oxidoreductase [Candidatus Methylacidiphilales bacterium]|nr:FAD-dependent oxidoreductase [Candidatus Methylacidiphilales bacterium]
MTQSADAVVVGGGFFGMYLALLLKARGLSPVILERGPDFMLRASYHNQARVHNGYHYPRSLMTAVRSRVNFPHFLQDFPESIVEDFDKYYAVGRVLGKVTADQFETFMARVGAPLQPAPERVSRLFSSPLIEKVWKVREVAFDAGKLRLTMRKRLEEAGVEFYFEADARCLTHRADGAMELAVETNGGRRLYGTPWVFNCTYSGLNRLRYHSGLPLLPLKHELTEMALVQPPQELQNLAVTVMCGPFFSLMPFPDRGLWTLSHVRYTPHHAWKEGGSQSGTEAWQDAYEHFDRAVKSTDGPLMIRDAARYLPAMSKCRQEGSLWEVKTVLPQSELDDGRPILFHRDPEMRGLVSLMGGKLDNIYDIPQELAALGLGM